jgi:hypothetical protein
VTPRSYYLYQATANCVFFSPIFFLYYQDRVGLGVSAILWLQSYAVAVRALLDLPFGALADRYSRGACLVAAALAQAAGASALLLAPTLAVAWLAETAFATAAALRSGADSAFLYDSLRAAGRLERYAAAESRAQAVSSLASGATAVLGGFLAAVDLRLPYAATVAATGLAAAVAAGFGGEPRPPRASGTARHLMGDAARHALTTPAVRWAIGLAATAVTASHVYFYLQQPYLRAIGVPVAAFGVVFAATKAVTALVASVAHRIDAAAGARGAALVMTAAPALGLGAMSLLGGPFGAVVLLSRGVLDGLWMPLANVYLNRLVESRLRATMLSLQSLVARLVQASAIAALGVGVAAWGLAPTVAAAAAATAVVGLVLVARAPTACRPGPV